MKAPSSGLVFLKPSLCRMSLKFHLGILSNSSFAFLILSLAFFHQGVFGQQKIQGEYDAQYRVFRMKNGNSSDPFRHGLAAYSDHQKDLMGLIDTSGQVIMEPRYYEIEGFGGGLSRVTAKAEPWELTYGFIDTLGNEVLSPIFDDADTWFYRSMRFAEVLVVSKDGLYGIYDYSGKELAPHLYQSINDFRNGLSRVYRDDLYGYLNKKGKEVISAEYEEARDFGLFMALVKKDGKYGWIDTTGNTVIPFEYETAADFNGEWAKVKKDGKTFFIDRKGNPKLPVKFEGVGNYKEGLAWARKDGKWGFIDTSGAVVIPLKYKKTGNFENGRAWVWLDNKWGHINAEGEVTTPIIYDRVGDFSRGYTGDSVFASVSINGNYGKVGINGNLAIPCEYIGIDHYSMGLAKVKKKVGESYKFGFVDYHGKEVIPCVYNKVDRFTPGRPLIIVVKDQFYGLINAKGEEIIPCKYLSINALSESLYQARDSSGTYFFNKSGELIEKK